MLSRRSSSPLAAVVLAAALVACASSSTRPGAAPLPGAVLAVPSPESDGPFFEFQVEKPVRQLRGTCVPKYPEDLRAARTTGQVVAHFVVDTAGMIEPATFKVLRSSHGAFSAAVQEVVPCMRFQPASIRGRRVRQVVQQPFVFDLAR
jgi:protein TonB